MALADISSYRFVWLETSHSLAKQSNNCRVDGREVLRTDGKHVKIEFNMNNRLFYEKPTCANDTFQIVTAKWLANRKETSRNIVYRARNLLLYRVV